MIRHNLGPLPCLVGLKVLGIIKYVIGLDEGSTSKVTFKYPINPIPKFIFIVVFIKVLYHLPIILILMIYIKTSV